MVYLCDMKQLIVVFYVAVFVLVGVIPWQVHGSVSIDTNLSLGSHGEQVRLLQVVLNTDPDTLLAEHGPGSPGQETMYFGPLTHNAVIRFQEKYRTSILNPIGLHKGTGYVGTQTRSMIRQLDRNQMDHNTSKPNNTESPSPNTAVSSSSQKQNTELEANTVIHIDKIEPERGSNHTNVVIHGVGFEEVSEVITTFQRFQNPNIVSDKKMIFSLDFDGVLFGDEITDQSHHGHKAQDKKRTQTGSASSSIPIAIRLTTDDGVKSNAVVYTIIL